MKHATITDTSFLGSHICTHSTSGDYWIVSTLVLIFGLASTALALMPYQIASENATTVRLIFLMIGIVGIIYWWRGGRTAVNLYSKGIIYKRNKLIRILKWEEIDEIYQRSTQWGINFLPFGTVHTFSIVTNDGRLTLDSEIDGIASLGRHIQDQVFAEKLPDMIRTHDEGKRLQFGKLALQRSQGIWHRNAFIAWRDIRSVSVKDGYVVILKYGNFFAWRKISVAAVPNISIFLNLVQRPQAFTVS